MLSPPPPCLMARGTVMAMMLCWSVELVRRRGEDDTEPG